MPDTVPSGCRWCGARERDHHTRWHMGRGLHRYEFPEQWQIKQRMQARRAGDPVQPNQKRQEQQ